MSIKNIYQILENNFTLALDAYEYFKNIVPDNDEDEIVIRFERLLLVSDVEALMHMWPKQSKRDIQKYCDKRLRDTSNIHLKVKYGWNLWSLTGETNHRLLNSIINYTFAILESYLEKDDYNHADTFCHFLEKVFIYRGLIGDDKKRILKELLSKAICSENEQLRFQLLTNIYYQETDEIKCKEGFLRLTNTQLLAEVALKLVDNEYDETKLRRKLELAVYYADKTNDSEMKRKSNEMLGDYNMTHLYSDDEKNHMIAHLNDHLLAEAMACYKKAGNTKKLKKATLAFEENKKYLRYPKITHHISVDKRNEEIELWNKHIIDVVKGGTPAILNSLFGRSIDVFVSANIINTICNNSDNEFSFQKCFVAVKKDSFQNTRQTTYVKTMIHMLTDSTLRNNTFHVFALIIYNGMNEGTLTYNILKEELLNNGFGIEWYKIYADGTKIGTSYLERVELGLKDFMEKMFLYIQGDDVDWRYCTTFLSTQFEGLFRDVLYKLGEPVDRVRNNGDTELIPLESLLNSDKATEIFNNNDLMLFSQTFTKDGYNIRNEIAHGLLLPQEFTAIKALLVFLCVLRITKATKLVV